MTVEVWPGGDTSRHTRPGAPQHNTELGADTSGAANINISIRSEITEGGREVGGRREEGGAGLTCMLVRLLPLEQWLGLLGG